MKKTLSKITFVSILLFAGSAAVAEEASSPEAEDAQFAALLGPALLTHGDVRQSDARSLLNSWSDMAIFGPTENLPVREAGNFLIGLSEWHEPVRVEVIRESPEQ